MIDPDVFLVHLMSGEILFGDRLEGPESYVEQDLFDSDPIACKPLEKLMCEVESCGRSGAASDLIRKDGIVIV